MRTTSNARMLIDDGSFIIVKTFDVNGGVTYKKVEYSPPEKKIESGYVRLDDTLYTHDSKEILFCQLEKRYLKIPHPETIISVDDGQSILDPLKYYTWVDGNGVLKMSDKKPNFEQYRPVVASSCFSTMVHNSVSALTTPVRKKFDRLQRPDRPNHKAVDAKLFRGAPIMGKLTKHLKPILKDYTFGVEFETAITALPLIEQQKLPIHRLYDGSLPIYGAEYATDILHGIGGLNAVKDICKTLQLFTTINTQCALHVHFGNIPSDRESLLALFILYYRLQEEVLEILPRYISKPMEVAGKSKIYADRLLTLGIGHTFGKSLFVPSERKELISKWFSNLFQYYLGKPLTREWNRKSKETPWGERTWRSATRYVQLQMGNILVDPSKTVEFRVHHPSRNPDIVINWILICASIINYANKHTAQIISSAQSREKITLIDVLEDQGLKNPVVRQLINYINVLRNLRIEENLAALNFGTEASNVNAVYRFLREKAEAELSLDALPDGVKPMFSEIQSKKDKQRTLRLQI